MIAVGYTVIGILPLFLVSAQAVQLQRELGFGRDGLGLAVGLCFVASAAAATPAGRLADRIGASAGVKLSAALSLAAAGSMALLATRWWHLVAALVCCGIANAMAQVSTNVALAGSVRLERQGVAFGAKQAAVPLAGLVAGLAVPVIALVAGWRAAFFGAAAISAGALLYAPRLGRPGTRAPAARPRPTRLLVLMGIFGLLGGAVGNSLPAFAVDSAVTRGIGEGAAGLILALGSATAVVGRIGAGLVVDRRGSAGYTELLALTVAGSLALAVLAVSGGSDALFVVAIVASFGCAWSWQGLIYYAAVRSHPSAPGAATAFVLSSVYAGNVIGPVVVGLVAEHRSYDAAWGLAAVVLVLATPAGIAARRLHRRLGPGQPR